MFDEKLKCLNRKYANNGLIDVVANKAMETIKLPKDVCTLIAYIKYIQDCNLSDYDHKYKHNVNGNNDNNNNDSKNNNDDQTRVRMTKIKGEIFRLFNEKDKTFKSQNLFAFNQMTQKSSVDKRNTDSIISSETGQVASAMCDSIAKSPSRVDHDAQKIKRTVSKYLGFCEIEPNDCNLIEKTVKQLFERIESVKNGEDIYDMVIATVENIDEMKNDGYTKEEQIEMFCKKMKQILAMLV